MSGNEYKKCDTCGLCLFHDDFTDIKDFEVVDDATAVQGGVCKDCGIDITFEYMDNANQDGCIYLEKIMDKELHDADCKKPDTETSDIIRSEYVDIVYQMVTCKNCTFKGKIRWDMIDSYPSSCEEKDHINNHPEDAICEECHIKCD